MNDYRRGAIALFAGSAGLILTMLLHPTGHELLRGGHPERVALVSGIAHGIGIASIVVLLLGAMAISKRLAAPDRLALTALVVYGFGVAAGVMAPVLSGFVTPNVARQILVAEPPAEETWRVLSHYSFLLNQACAKVRLAATAAAILLWSLAMLKSWRPARLIGGYGILLAAVLLAWLFSGTLRLTVHAFGMVVLAESVWFVAVGILLWFATDSQAAAARV